jgi:DNA-binding NarL/FixJ family response regulator
MTGRPSLHLVELTEKQAEALSLLARGLGRTQIASEMHVSAMTVRSHLRGAMDRLGARDGAHAVQIAEDLGLILSTPSP